MKIQVAARQSPLSQVQLDEVYQMLRLHHAKVEFEPLFLETRGDKEKGISLRQLERTDFFTREIDQLLLEGGCRIAVHSAKDLPDPLPKGLKLIALTHGVDHADSLLLRTGESVENLPSQAVIATSSERREHSVSMLRPDLKFVDIRGTIGERIEKLENHEVDGLIVAEAALIRLGLTYLNRVRLTGATAPLQGQLAVIAKEHDKEMEQLFLCLDTRKVKKEVIYFGLQLPQHYQRQDVIHFPIIKVLPRSDIKMLEFVEHVNRSTHLVFTSQNAVSIFFDLINKQHLDLSNKTIVAVGEKTANLCNCFFGKILIPTEETAEGIVRLLRAEDLHNSYFFWPHSSGSRSVLTDFFSQQKVRFRECVLYDTYPFKPYPLPTLNGIKELVFTSPSTVKAFLQFYGSYPSGVKLSAIGPITGAYLQKTKDKDTKDIKDTKDKDITVSFCL